MSLRGLRYAGTCLLGGALFVAGSPGQGAGISNPLIRPSQESRQAKNSVLLALTKAGKRLVAAGERGIVLFSDDLGVNWQQASVPSSNTLTAVRFVDPSRGWAVGHGGVVLATVDGGLTWSRQLDGKRAAELAVRAAESRHDAAAIKAAKSLLADGPDKPFLDLYFRDAKNGFVVGAYGLIYGTEDGGNTWSSWMNRLDNPKGLHLNAIGVQEDRVMLVGEQGLLLYSMNGGASFSRLPSPYEGSWFAVAPQPDKRWLIGGLKGRLYSVNLQGPVSFTAIDVPTPVTLTSLAVLRDGQVIALNQAGQLELGRDGGRPLRAVKLPPGPPLTQVVEMEGDLLLGVSLRGIRELPRLNLLP